VKPGDIKFKDPRREKQRLANLAAEVEKRNAEQAYVFCHESSDCMCVMISNS
jgi:hypothetical protein